MCIRFIIVHVPVFSLSFAGKVYIPLAEPFGKEERPKAQILHKCIALDDNRRQASRSGSAYVEAVNTNLTGFEKTKLLYSLKTVLKKSALRENKSTKSNGTSRLTPLIIHGC